MIIFIDLKNKFIQFNIFKNIEECSTVSLKKNPIRCLFHIIFYFTFENVKIIIFFFVR